jgi:excisionase family DNA binding protein
MKKTAPTVSPAPGWFTPKEAAAHLSVHVESIYDACQRKGLRHSKLGYKTIRIKREWLDDWAETYVPG